MIDMYSKLPHYVIIKNERFIINADFRIFIDFEEEILQGIDLKEVTKKTLNRFYPAFFEIYQLGLINEAIDKFIWFYQCGDIEEKEKKSKSKSKAKRSQVYSYYHDSMYIWGTYKQYFNVDLSKDKVHWWAFKSLWETIPSESEYSKIRGYRAYSGDDKDMLELKEFYKLPPAQKEIEEQARRDKIYEALK